MNAPLSTEIPQDRRRAIEVEFLTERYHRAFDEEASTLGALAAAAGEAALEAALDRLRLLLETHEHLQEDDLFPAYEHGVAVDPAFVEAWLEDSASIAEATSALRHVCRSSLHARLDARAIHFAAEIDRHLVDEGAVLAAWTARS